tara:strand:- start:303 stop:764 length:462 start_codon:yes stop_codon:yes gene_type:complete
MKNFKEFAIESYTRAGYIDERGCSVEYLDENWKSQLWNKVGKPASDAYWRSFAGDTAAELTGNDNFKPSTPFTKGYDKSIDTINQNSTKKNKEGQTLGRTGNSKFKRALEIGSNFVPWEKIPGGVWKYGVKPAWEITKAIGGAVLGGGMSNKF